MTIETHPQYDDWLTTWQKMRDCMSEDTVKGSFDTTLRTSGDSTTTVGAAGTKYLPMTSGQLEAYSKNCDTAAYDRYLSGAKFDAALADIVDDSVGLAFAEPWVVSIPENSPDAMKEFIQYATPSGGSMEMAMRDTVVEQLIVGREGILMDWPDGTNPKPYVVKYPAESIFNWVTEIVDGREVLTRVDLLDAETSWKDGSWEDDEVYRVLTIEDDQYVIYANLAEDEVDSLPSEKRIEPTYNGQSLSYIPFYFAGVKNFDSEVEQPTYLSVANTALTKYRRSADYAQALFMQGQATPWGKGLNTEDQEKLGLLGATAMPMFSSDEAMLEMLEVKGNGLTEMREDQENLAKQLTDAGVRLSTDASQESGRALQMRLTSKVASLRSIVKVCADVYEQILKDMGGMMGMSESDIEEIVVEPYTGFGDQIVTLADARALLDARSAGAPIPMKAVHAAYKLAGAPLTDFEMDLAEAETDGPVMGDE